MISSLLERRPGRAQEFFRLVRFLLLLTIGPSLLGHSPSFEGNLSQQLLLASLAIYGEAVAEGFLEFLDTIWFGYLWITKDTPRSYSRRLRGINLPNFMVPVTDDTNTGTQMIRGYAYLRVAVLAGIAAAVACVPAIVLHAVGIRTLAEQRIVSISLFLIVTIGTGGNLLAGILFLIEWLGHEGVIVIGGDHMRIVLPVVYSLWILFVSVHLFCRIWVHTNSNPRLRALANVFLFKVTTDAVVAATERHAGQIDTGAIFANIEEQDGTAEIKVGTKPTTQKVSLAKVEKVS